ncbi:hypothetical protein H5410_021522 [Solanum commersonii]|uniref:Uncharacterized protein n=1 Tax=Solanum commersonii TaxID=4109 RepID=A0A9J5ZBL1_SOLCO|nr:hypothetical protein H5410_021522 [Solanum commersonii]
MVLADVQFERDFPQIMCQPQELRMGFIFHFPLECNSHFVIVYGMEVPLTPMDINQVLGTTEAPSDILTGLNINPLYQKIRHTLCGEARVWLKIVMDFLIPGLNLTKVARDRACLFYALMNLPINVGAILKLAMRKARVNRG